MGAFKKGDVVEWKSGAGGATKKKQGKIQAVVPAGEPAVMANGDFSIEFDLPAKARDNESYLVMVPNVRKGRPGLYWPLASKLKLVRTAEVDAKAVEDASNNRTKGTPNEDVVAKHKGQRTLEGMPERDAMGVACDNYLEQVFAVKAAKAQLKLMGQGVLSAMQKEGRKRLTLDGSDGESYSFEVLPSGFHLKVAKAKE